MLEQMRRSSQTLLIYVLFGILIAVFVINFGPQSAGGCEGQQANVQTNAATVGGRTLTVQDFNFGYILTGAGQASPQVARQLRLKETIMDRLIERELLAQEAERLGFRISDEEVEDQIEKARFIALGRNMFTGSFQPVEQELPVQNKKGNFDYDMFKKFALYQLGMSPRTFIDEQRREMLAARVRNLLKDGLHVSLDEVKTDFMRRGNQVNVEYVRFTTSRYESEVEPTAAEIEAYAKANEAKLKEQYTTNKFLYEKAKDRKLRQILVKIDSGASADGEAAAKKKAEALLARVKKGEAFAAVAKAASEDSATKARGGDLGWRREGTTALGPPIETKVWAAKEGEVIGPEKGADGFYLVSVEGKREGELPFEQVRLEMAEVDVRKEKVKTRAKADAEAGLAKAKGAAAKSLKDLFPAPADKDKDKDKAKGAEAIKVTDAASTAPQAEETGLFMRRGAQVEGIGPSNELAKAVFALTTESPFAGPVEVSGSYIIAKLKERKNPDMAEFEKKKLELQRLATQMKGEEVVAEWTMRRCVEAKEAKRIGVNRELLRYEQGPEGAVAYEPCTPPLRF
jgi:peptidyl-prolyl cis-trans isomerase D